MSTTLSTFPLNNYVNYFNYSFLSYSFFLFLFLLLFVKFQKALDELKAELKTTREELNKVQEESVKQKLYYENNKKAVETDVLRLMNELEYTREGLNEVQQDTNDLEFRLNEISLSENEEVLFSKVESLEKLLNEERRKRLLFSLDIIERTRTQWGQEAFFRMEELCKECKALNIL